jgi:hypothetical protein
LKRHISILILSIVAIPPLALGSFGCVAANGADTANGPVINSLVAEHTSVYPVGNTVVTCSAVARDGGALTYQWVANDGTIIGNGPTITWEAPKTYGDFHIMCTAFDSRGNKSSQTVTVTVIVRDPTKCCR